MPTSGTGIPRIKGRNLGTNSKGFTLIELMIVIVIVGITLGYIGPRIFSGIFASDMDQSVRDITTMIQLTRSSAVTKHKTYFIRFDLDNEKVAMYPMPESTGLEPEMERERQLVEGVVLKSVKSPYQSEKDRGEIDLKVTSEGVVEQGVIYIEGSFGRIYTLVVKPFSGTLKIYDHYVEVTYG
ncbi:MAG TPA: type II secretion system protein [Deltaproteobacteria bacterium]|nr:type II secretion system protein [Deltaproteobacteria bacterium]HPR54612.1 type II secretion system protein [Deltaproteobacteria bacterium]HXK47256.1 type II secretion system protein [Deltaproteobacteria bacterium]